tara:strand:- start:491 stop:1516 length:1026 start_codon:yes stop_codon:yes gene_type:complete
MFENDKKLNTLFFNWLLSSLILVFLIIIVGGLTRLTNSGLSITEWELFSGVLPPMNHASWQFYFESYQKIPQYKLVNYNMNINEFKIIFYWEYAHRILARLIGLFFLFPLIFFYISRKINKKYLRTSYIILFLILTQGFVGWYMVKSGLINVVVVSHYRLAVHLFLAFVIISTIFWLLKNIIYKTDKNFFTLKKSNLPFLFLIFLIFLQVISGALVSGLDAGRIYQTWPLMGTSYFPNDLNIINFKILTNLSNHSLVQFYHRNLGYIITIYIFILGFYIYNKNLKNLFKPLKILFIFLLLQIILGVFTLISGLNIYLASAHQINSVLLVFTAINLYFYQTK